MGMDQATAQMPKIKLNIQLSVLLFKSVLDLHKICAHFCYVLPFNSSHVHRIKIKNRLLASLPGQICCICHLNSNIVMTMMCFICTLCFGVKLGAFSTVHKKATCSCSVVVHS